MSHKKVPAGDKTSGDNTHTKRTEDYRKPAAASFPGKAEKSPIHGYGAISLEHDNRNGSVTAFVYRGLILPSAPSGDPIQHDCELCASGVKDFVRPATSSEMLDACVHGKICTHMFVHEVCPGVGVRHFVTCVGGN